MPRAGVLAPDADRDARAFEPVSPRSRSWPPGWRSSGRGWCAGGAGAGGYFGGEQAAAERLVDQVAARTGVECQVGLADGLFAAVLAARRGLAVAPGDTPAFLAPLGVEELDREPDIDRSELVDLLRRLGLRTLGAFAALPRRTSRPGSAPMPCSPPAGPRAGFRARRCVAARPEELTVEIELDPPVDRVDAAAFAARGLAERLHAHPGGPRAGVHPAGCRGAHRGGRGAAPGLAVRGAAQPAGTSTASAGSSTPG